MGRGVCVGLWLMCVAYVWADSALDAAPKQQGTMQANAQMQALMAQAASIDVVEIIDHKSNAIKGFLLMREGTIIRRITLKEPLDRSMIQGLSHQEIIERFASKMSITSSTPSTRLKAPIPTAEKAPMQSSSTPSTSKAPSPKQALSPIDATTPIASPNPITPSADLTSQTPTTPSTQASNLASTPPTNTQNTAPSAQANTQTITAPSQIFKAPQAKAPTPITTSIQAPSIAPQASSTSVDMLQPPLRQNVYERYLSTKKSTEKKPQRKLRQARPLLNSSTIPQEIGAEAMQINPIYRDRQWDKRYILYEVELKKIIDLDR